MKGIAVKSKINLIKIAFLVLALPLSAKIILAATPAQESNPKEDTSVFATVGKERITWQAYQAAYAKEARSKLYHGQPSDDVMAVFQRKVSDQLVTDALILNEANRRKLKPDSDVVDQGVADFERQMANNERWKEARERTLPAVIKRIQNENLVKKLESVVRQVAAPKDAQIKAYYIKHPEKFTAPVEQRAVHSARFVLVDKNGAIRGYYDGLSDVDNAALARDARRLLEVGS